MNAAETRASSAIALCTALTVVSRSLTTAEIDTFINDVSTTSTNIAAANKSDSRVLPASWRGTLTVATAYARALAFRASNSAWLIAPVSSSCLALSISAAAPPLPATDLT